MRKSCCIDDANFTPRSSSCSMVLRSACTHGYHSYNCAATKISHSKDVNRLKKKCLTESTVKKKSSFSKNSGIFETYFQSSFKKFAYKSAKTYYVLKDSIYNHLDYSSKLRNKSTNEKEASSESLDELYSFTKSKRSFVNNSINAEELCHVNNNHITSNYFVMSKSRDFARSSIAAVNALSDSENEDSLSKGAVKKRVSKRTSKSHSSTRKTESLSSNNHSHHNSVSVNNVAHSSYEATLQGSYKVGSNSNFQTPTSSILYRSNMKNSHGSDTSSTTVSPGSPTVIDISNVQHTLIDRFRWFLWKSIYLKIIKCVNFDVWLLSRSHNHRKFLILLLLIPFLIYLLSGIDSQNFMAFDKLNSIAYFPSSFYSIVSSPFIYQKSVISETSKESSKESSTCSQKAYDLISAISSAPWYLFLTLYSNTKNFLFTDNKDDLKVVALENKRHDKVIALELEIERLKEEVSKMKGTERNIPVKESGNKMLVPDIYSLRLEFQSLTEFVKKLEKDVSVKYEGSSKFGNTIKEHDAYILSINTKMKLLEDKLSSLSVAIKNCYDQRWTLADFIESFEKYFLAALKTMVERDNDKNSPYYFFTEWLQTKLIADKEILSQLKLEFEKMKSSGANFDENVVENVIKKHMESFKKDFKLFNKADVSGGTFSLDVVQKLIREAILLYDADKTGKVDYALESGGGSVLSTRCSESYAEKDGTISVLGLPLWSTHSSPRTVIQPGMQPGQCWAFKGSQGFLVIQLSYTIQVTGFTLEHIPLSLSPSGSIDSAPKDFSVWGLFSEKDNEGKLLGHYTFDQHGDSLQYFPAQNVYSESFSFVELKILSNWGNLEYTCLYRFRVHGKQPKH